MQISINWIRKLIKQSNNITNHHIIDNLIKLGIEVDEINNLNTTLNNAIFAQINNIITHHNKNVEYIISDGINIETFISKHHKLKINDILIIKYKHKFNQKDYIYNDIKNYKNNCFFSLNENLHFTLDNKNPLILKDKYFSYAIGHKFLDIINTNDKSITLNTSYNRTDLNSHLGIAKELSTLYKTTIYNNKKKNKYKFNKLNININIKKTNICKKYSCILLKDITIKQSPLFIITKLITCHINPINNIIDIINYISLETGQAMHVYDYDTLIHDNHIININVDTACKNQQFTSINNITHTLSKNDIVIYNNSYPIALAGIIGSNNTKITYKTKNILIESACFNKNNIKNSVSNHNIHTKSSNITEKEINPNNTLIALTQAINFMTKYANANLASSIHSKSSSTLTINKKCIFDINMFFKISGTSKQQISNHKIYNILYYLNIKIIKKQNKKILVIIPTYRVDIKQPIDIIEEILKIFGFHNIKNNMITTNTNLNTYVSYTYHDISLLLKTLFISFGFCETINFTFNSLAISKQYSILNEQNIIRINNPLSNKLNAMRQSLLPGLIKNIITNQNKYNNNIRLFEIGNIFVKNLKYKNKYQYWANELYYFSGIATNNTYQENNINNKNLTFFDFKGFIEKALKLLKIQYYFHNNNTPLKQNKFYVHPKIYMNICSTYNNNNNNINIGYLGELHPNIQKQLKIKHKCFIFELNLTNIYKLHQKDIKFHNYPKFPSIKKNLSLIMNNNIIISNIISYIKSYPNIKHILKQIYVIDIYYPSHISNTIKTLTLSLIFQSNMKTLTDNDIHIVIANILHSLKKQFNILLRKI